MHVISSLLAVVCVITGFANGQQGEKGNSIIPFPRVGRSGNSPGLIPYPRVGRADGGIHESKRQLIPFPRVGKRAFWRFPVESAYYTEYEDLAPSVLDSNFLPPPFAAESSMSSSSSDDSDVDKRGGNPSSSGGLWFGPRLGRKKRSVDGSAATEDASSVDMKQLINLLHTSNWAIVVPVKDRRTFTPRLGKKGGQPFSPRLGRSGFHPVPEYEGYENYNIQSHFHRRSPSQESTDSPIFDRGGPPFNPRLGRNDPFSPRLGRAPFSPRLGRNPYSPRLGRRSELRAQGPTEE